MKEFNPRVKNINSLGKELRFQREYYCFKHNTHLPLKINNNKVENMDTLGDVLYKFIERNFGDNSELATSYEVLYAIENEKSKKKGEVYNQNAYFLRIFCLLEIYGFLGTMTILELLEEKYKIEPSFQSSKKILLELKQESPSFQEYLAQDEAEKVIKTNVKNHKILMSKEQFINICDNKAEMIEELEKKYKTQKVSIIRNGKITEVKREDLIKKGMEFNALQYGYDWNQEHKELINKMRKLSKIEQYCISLELGRDTNYIKDFINDNIQNININTLLKTVKYFNMQNTEFYNILLEQKKNFFKDTFREIEMV